MTAAVKPLTAATERSISPSSSTITTPTAIVPVAAICSIRFVTLSGERKRSFSEKKIAQMMTMPISTGNEPRSPPVRRRRRAPTTSLRLCCSSADAALCCASSASSVGRVGVDWLMGSLLPRRRSVSR